MAIQAFITDEPRTKAAATPTAVPAATIPETRPSNGVEKFPLIEPRRFDLPDINRHGPWLIPRFEREFPHFNHIQVLSFLRSVLYSNEFMFLFQPHGAALAQVMNEQTLQPEPVVWERFVFLEDAKDPYHIAEGVEFYKEFARWTRQKQSASLVVDQHSDVPRDEIRKKLGRLSVQELQVAKLGKE